MEVGLPDVDEDVVEHEAGGDELEAGAAEEAGKGAEGRDDGLSSGFAGEDDFAEESAKHRAEDDAKRAEEDEADKKAGKGTSGGVSAAAGFLGEDGWDDIIDNRNEDGDGKPDKEKAGGHGISGRVSAMPPEEEDEHACPADGRAGDDWQDAADDADDSKEDCQGNYYDVNHYGWSCLFGGIGFWVLNFGSWV